MKAFNTMALGCFIIAAAHYVRDGDTVWYMVWAVLGGLITVALSRKELRDALSLSTQEKGK